MNKGFTLAELMGVIVIIGVIAIIATVAIDRSIKNSRYETCLAQEKNIIEGAQTWAIDHPRELPNAGEIKMISITTLQNEGHLEILTSPMTNKVFSETTSISITSSNGTSYEYAVNYGDEAEKCTK